MIAPLAPSNHLEHYRPSRPQEDANGNGKLPRLVRSLASFWQGGSSAFWLPQPRPCEHQPAFELIAADLVIFISRIAVRARAYVARSTAAAAQNAHLRWALPRAAGSIETHHPREAHLPRDARGAGPLLGRARTLISTSPRSTRHLFHAIDATRVPRRRECNATHHAVDVTDARHRRGAFHAVDATRSSQVRNRSSACPPPAGGSPALAWRSSAEQRPAIGRRTYLSTAV